MEKGVLSGRKGTVFFFWSKNNEGEVGGGGEGGVPGPLPKSRS